MSAALENDVVERSQADARPRRVKAHHAHVVLLDESRAFRALAHIDSTLARRSQRPAAFALD
jgi:hypothetical protein